MKRLLLNVLALLAGFVFSAFFVLAHAETIPATKWYQASWSESSCAYCSGDSVAAVCAKGTWSQGYTLEEGGCRSKATNLFYAVLERYECPSTGGWSLQGSNCYRPDEACQAGTTSTASRYTGVFSTGVGTGVYGVPTPPPATLCNGTCSGTINSVTSCNSSTVVKGTPIQCTYSITLTGATCSGGNGAAPVDPLPTAPSPPCNPGDGVASNSSGKVVCVPNGQNFQGATYPPVERKSSSTQTFGDGSTKTTTTTQVCTGDGACATSTVTNVTAASGGGAGQAGTPGTSTTQTDKPQQPSKFCAENPDSQICKGDMNKEATQQKILDEIKKFQTPDATDDSVVRNATHSAQSEQAMKDEVAKLDLAVKGQFDATSSSKSAWESAMASGWWSPVPPSSCQPINLGVGGRSFTIDHCPVAARLSDWGAYGLWFLTAVGIFVMLTGGNGKKEGA